jgi:hypothetical protein
MVIACKCDDYCKFIKDNIHPLESWVPQVPTYSESECFTTSGWAVEFHIIPCTVKSIGDAISVNNRLNGVLTFHG